MTLGGSFPRGKSAWNSISALLLVLARCTAIRPSCFALGKAFHNFNDDAICFFLSMDADQFLVR